MTYLFIGPDIQKKDAKIAELKAKFLTDPSAVSFDYEILHAHKLDPDVLKESLIALPLIATKRLIVLRQCERLNQKKNAEDHESLEEGAAKLAAANSQERKREIILKFLESPNRSTILILDFEKVNPESSFFIRLKPLVEVLNFGSLDATDTWAMTRAITAGNSGEALRIFHILLENNIHPLQIMGGLVWYWGKERGRLNPANFRKGLSVLEEADLNIKRSRLKSEYAIEKAIVELVMIQ